MFRAVYGDGVKVNIMFDGINEEEIKQLIFEIYSAGFEAGYSQEVDIVSAYNQYWDNLLELIKE